MPNLRANGIQLEYDSFGDVGAPPLLLIMGLGAQMIVWDEDFCRGLADRGHFVVRFDNRDVGLSSKIEDGGVPDVMSVMAAAARGEKPEAPYTLHDMADDAAGLIEALGFGSAHVVGASMGGMIAQTLALRHPLRVRTLTSIMSTTGRSELPPPTSDAMQAMLAPVPSERAAYIDHHVRLNRTIAGKGFPYDEAGIRKRGGRLFDRSFYPDGVARQIAAIMASGSRHDDLASLRIPTLVIHGTQDPLIPVESGTDTAEAIPGAELLLIEGMGHDLPIPAWPRVHAAIARLTAV